MEHRAAFAGSRCPMGASRFLRWVTAKHQGWNKTNLLRARESGMEAAVEAIRADKGFRTVDVKKAGTPFA